MKSICKNCAVALFGTLLGQLSISAAQGQTTIGVSPFAPTSSAFSVGEAQGSNPGLGETFTVTDSNQVLNSITVYATTDFNADAGLDASVYEWSPITNTPVGSAVWSTTTPQTIPGSTFSIPVLVTFPTGGVQLNPADDYIFEFTAYNSALVTGEPAIFVVDQATYPSGFMVPFGGASYYPTPGANLDFYSQFRSNPRTLHMGVAAGRAGSAGFLASAHAARLT